MSVEELKKVVEGLPAKDFAQFRAWFDELSATLWDEQIERDAKSGKLDRLAKEALEDVAAGRFRKL
jgi:hypothetical protein